MEREQSAKWPGESDDAHPDVFTQPPTFPEELKPGQLNKPQFHQFFEEGYVLLEDLFHSESDKKVLQKARQQIKDMVNDLAKNLYKAGKIKSLYNEYGLFQRLTKLEEDFPGSNIILHKTGKLPLGFRDLWSHPKLLNICEQLLGTPNISGSPVWNIRPKTPRNDATVLPWHQDSSYFDESSYKELIVTAWIPLLDVSEHNGCMQVAKNGHKTGKIATHQCCYGKTWYTMLEETEMERKLGVDLQNDIITCPMRYGSVLLFSNLLPHRSVSNLSNDVRWSLDLRWQRTGSPAGLFGHKATLPMRSLTDPNMDIDWDEFDKEDRHKKAFEDLGLSMSTFDTTIQGPWMKKWEIVHVNSHTEAFIKHEELSEN